MARPKKQTVDYFPHFVKSGRTIFILESRFGNNGYAFWFKLLEILGEAEGHFYDCSNASNWAFLLAKVRLSENEVNQLINVLIDLGKIDKDLWTQSKIIWVDNFVNNLSEVYRTRHSALPGKPPYFKESKCDEKVDNVTEDDKPQEICTPKLDAGVESNIISSKVIIDMWNEICGDKLSRISSIHEERKKNILRCIKESNNTKEEDIVKWFKELFEKVAASKFLLGDKGWKASFDWVIEQKNWVKILEGNFDCKNGRNKHKGTEVSATSSKDYEGTF